jgi:hypothetical protein
MPFANAQFVAQGSAKAWEGMSLIRPVDLHAGQVIYRFYDAARVPTPAAGANGPWWVEFEAFQHITHFAQRHGYAFSYSARLFAAILYGWSAVNAFVRCEVMQPRKGWKGRGKPVESRGKDARDLPTMTRRQRGLEVYQLCVPGLGGPAALASSVLKVVGSGPL